MYDRKDGYTEMTVKETAFASFLDGNGFEHEFNTNTYPITLTVTPKAKDEEQTRLYELESGDCSSSDASLTLSFFVDNIGVRITGRLVMSEETLNKIKSAAKKLHYTYLQCLHRSGIVSAYRKDDGYAPSASPVQTPADFEEFFNGDTEGEE